LLGGRMRPLLALRVFVCLRCACGWGRVSLMAEMLLATFHGNLRTALADQGSGGVYAWKDEVLDGALLSVMQMGLGPAGVVVNDDEDGFDPGPASADARGLLVLQAALLLMGGQLPVGFKTRALSVMIRETERMETIAHLRRLIQRLEQNGDPHGTGTGGACFGVWQDLENELWRRTEVVRTT